MLNMKDLTNKTIIITGGAGLLGSAFSRACAESGANVLLVDIDERKGNDLVEILREKTKNSNLIFQNCDITDIGKIQDLINIALREFGNIDALINNAYPRNNNYGKKFEDIDYKDFCDNVNMHLGGYFLMTQQVAKVMMEQKYGNIINMASIYGFAAPRFEIYEGTKMTMPAEYAAIKGAIINLTRYLASYLGRYNIRVNAISPGGVFNNQPESFIKSYSERVVLGKRMATPDDLIDILLFLLSDGSKYTTGQNIVIDGGFSL